MNTPTITPELRALLYSVQRDADYLDLVNDTISAILERTVIDDDLTDKESMRIVRTLYTIRADYRALAAIDGQPIPHDDDDADQDESTGTPAITGELLKLINHVQRNPDYVELINDVISEIVVRIVIDDDLTDCRAMSIIRTLYSIRGDYRDLSATDARTFTNLDESEDPEPNEEGGDE